jgi:multiple sugar transport system substrate-binding protein
VRLEARLVVGGDGDPAGRRPAYWQELIDAGAVDVAPDSNTEWYPALDRGKYVVWNSAAWGPVFLSGVA